MATGTMVYPELDDIYHYSFPWIPIQIPLPSGYVEIAIENGHL